MKVKNRNPEPVLKQNSREVLCVLPDDVIVVSQVELLAVLSGVVDDAHSGHEVHHLLPGSVVQVIAALVAPVPVDPVQSEPAARGAPVRHARSSDGTACPLGSSAPPAQNRLIIR